MRRPRITIIGGGITGVTAALRLADNAEVTLLEAGPRLGGKIGTGPDGIEDGAEQFLMRDPRTGGPSAAARLAADVGQRIVHPASLPAGLYTRGELRSLPAGTVMGIPSSSLAGFEVRTELDVDTGAPVLAADSDIAVGPLVRARLGDDVVDRLVDPLLGGVYAGRADELSMAATMPELHRVLRSEHTLSGAVARISAASRAHAAGAGPVFGSLDGGLSQLVMAAAEAAKREGAEIRTDTRVTALRRVARGMEVQAGGAWLEADGVMLAVPATPAARMLTFLAPEASEAVSALDYASVGLVTLVLPPIELPALTGFLVPAIEGMQIKAATFLSQKWPEAAPGVTVIRASLGRHGENAVLRSTDPELVALVSAEVGQVLGMELPEPIHARVSRWGGGLPQYAPGHLDRVVQARAALDGLPIVLAGAAYDGIGIPACITSSERASAHLTQLLA